MLCYANQAILELRFTHFLLIASTLNLSMIHQVLHTLSLEFYGEVNAWKAAAVGTAFNTDRLFICQAGAATTTILVLTFIDFDLLFSKFLIFRIFLRWLSNLIDIYAPKLPL